MFDIGNNVCEGKKLRYIIALSFNALSIMPEQYTWYCTLEIGFWWNPAFAGF